MSCRRMFHAQGFGTQLVHGIDRCVYSGSFSKSVYVKHTGQPPTMQQMAEGQQPTRLLTRQEYENSNIVSCDFRHVAIRAMKHGPGGNVRGARLDEVDFSRKGTIEEDEIVLTFDDRVGSDDSATYPVALDEHTS